MADSPAQCRSCGEVVAPGAGFCPSCGAEQIIAADEAANRRSVNWIVLGAVGVALVAVSVLATLSFAGSGAEEETTLYESLDLSSPERAVETFTEAFGAGDYLSAYLAMSPPAQAELHALAQLFRHDRLVDTSREGTVDLMMEEVPKMANGLLSGEHMDSGWYMQHQMWTFAAEHDAFLIDLRGDVEIQGSVPVGSIESETVDISASVEGIEGETVFRLRQVPSGNWKVDQVIVPGGDEEQIPWSVVPIPEPETERYALEFMVPCPPDGFVPAASDSQGPVFEVDPTCAEPGMTATVHGFGFPSEAEGDVSFRPESGVYLSMQTLTTDADGAFVIEVTIPDRVSDAIQHVVVTIAIP